VSLETSRLEDDKLAATTQKSGSRIFVPLPPIAVQALKTIHRATPASIAYRKASQLSLS
jgi:hypothetical protein